MLTKEKIINFLKSNYDYIHTNYHILKIGLIGSFARDEQNENSDIDLLIEFEPDTEDIFDLKLNLKEYLKSNLNREIDLCREKYLKPYVKDFILNEVIYV